MTPFVSRVLTLVVFLSVAGLAGCADSAVGPEAPARAADAALTTSPTLRTPPAAPQMHPGKVQVTGSIVQGSPHLSWPVEPEAEYYRIYRVDSYDNTNDTFTTTGTSFTDWSRYPVQFSTQIDPSIIYYVTAVNIYEEEGPHSRYIVYKYAGSGGGGGF